MADYYELLGISRDADDGDIKRAYRKLALKYHPDRNNGSKDAEERFKEVTQAYDVLRDPDKRRVYDQYGAEGLRGGPAGGGFGPFDFSDAIDVFMRDFGGFGGLGDLFGQQGRRSSGPRKGQSLKVRLPITLKEVVTGAERTLKVSVLDSCDRCEGSGAEPGTSVTTCSTCSGSGEERVMMQGLMGRMVTVQPCRRCRGEGRVIDQPCSRCHGEGRSRAQREVTVEVPPGVSSENYITLRGEGSVGPQGGPRGDVLVLIEVEDDPRFVRDEADLLTEKPITFSQAVLGADVEVATVDSRVKLTVPAGIQSGTVMRLRGQGLPELQGRGRGDLLVRVLVYTPQSLSDEQRRLFHELAEQEEEAPERVERNDDKGFWSRVREAFSGR